MSEKWATTILVFFCQKIFRFGKKEFVKAHPLENLRLLMCQNKKNTNIWSEKLEAEWAGFHCGWHKGAFKYYISAFGVEGLSQNAETADALEGRGGLSQNADMLILSWEGVGELKHRSSIAVKHLQLWIN